MPPTSEQGSEPHRIITTDELRRFEFCPLAWWYDRHHPLARASAPELARRMELFEAVYGPSARDLPEYHLLAHLREQIEQTPPDLARATPPIAPLDSPRPLVASLIAIALIVAALVAGGVIFTLVRP
jgi:hypothetical protein